MVRIGFRRMIVAGSGLPHDFDELLQVFERRLIDTDGGGARGNALEGCSDWIDLEQLLGGDLADLGTAEG